ncbi:class I SAM-dependent methyltransferase [Streptomyces sp. NPDC001401]|uniref:class I SAM-dependent methyltransferase n=1 Tax=Streptomyces sp. NPDC001401 TaxID=3364570 RepID=UPI00369281B9
MILTSAAYADPRRFAARQALYQWQRPRYDLPSLVLDAVYDRSGLIVDVGCGNGKYLERLRAARPDRTILGIDLSPGMLRDVTPPVAVADARRLPLQAESADAVLALHMLYHLPNPAAGIEEFRRILRPGGKVIVATNAASDKAEIQALWKAAHQVANLFVPADSLSFSTRFTLEDAQTLLPQYFDDVHLIHLDSIIAVTDPAPVLAYFSSYLPFPGQTEQTARRLIAALEQLVREVITRDGDFTISCRGGLFVCSGMRTH